MLRHDGDSFLTKSTTCPRISDSDITMARRHLRTVAASRQAELDASRARHRSGLGTPRSAAFWRFLPCSIGRHGCDDLLRWPVHYSLLISCSVVELLEQSQGVDHGVPPRPECHMVHSIPDQNAFENVGQTQRKGSVRTKLRIGTVQYGADIIVTAEHRREVQPCDPSSVGFLQLRSSHLHDAVCALAPHHRHSLSTGAYFV